MASLPLFHVSPKQHQQGIQPWASTLDRVPSNRHEAEAERKLARASRQWMCTSTARTFPRLLLMCVPYLFFSRSNRVVLSVCSTITKSNQLHAESSMRQQPVARNCCRGPSKSYHAHMNRLQQALATHRSGNKSQPWWSTMQPPSSNTSSSASHTCVQEDVPVTAVLQPPPLLRHATPGSFAWVPICRSSPCRRPARSIRTPRPSRCASSFP